MCGVDVNPVRLAADPFGITNKGHDALGILNPEKPQGPAAPGAQPAVAPPQAGQTADQAAARRALQALAAAGYGRAATGTMLTGPGGVSPNLLNVGRNTLLGS